ncbi:S-adenosylmethionine--tRNA ribosyltransferase-isomerase [Rubritalea squalenifaciens DSM 18772]|uniref:S-adenosylmethionine:tRNA ribosyltransferase-isomerase n=1 Tax=Rubritalea squalenifaciens DSM 18772 TaxID=1123071 RepID=A0A1M6KRH7_9BACT|nr:tRNA preQ1(34) S-adenosylmethionine ribosyltransferase-isomerase QueA [Rubritalea squalenifaciens]SHJ61490.1 S-adenosylmethionine--tRNA ribosyltransferase-isomerase [Rubritalea squalenifaciens DSM 18772]
MLRTDDFDYHLPEELIASQPLENRIGSRMLVLHRDTQTIEHRQFSDLHEYFTPEDLLVLNNTKVIPARVFSNDGKIELVVVDRQSATQWTCMVRPGKKMKPGRTVEVGESTGTVLETLPDGNRIIEWDKPVDLDTYGKLALPHYMGRDAEPEDRDRYQTTFAKEEGAIAAPTAGLHFTPDYLEKFPHTFLTLHVGIGTFRPVMAEFITDHKMHAERYYLSKESAKTINKAKSVTAVGTTVTRVLESLGRKQNLLTEAEGETDIFINPGFEFKQVDRLLTNFHLPKSTLIMLVSAFAGRDFTLRAYKEAVENRYRFFSYGDCMLIL